MYELAPRAHSSFSGRSLPFVWCSSFSMLLGAAVRAPFALVHFGRSNSSYPRGSAGGCRVVLYRDVDTIARPVPAEPRDIVLLCFCHSSASNALLGPMRPLCVGLMLHAETAPSFYACHHSMSSLFNRVIVSIPGDAPTWDRRSNANDKQFLPPKI